MVDALRRISRWLRPGGLVLDLQPEPERSWLLVDTGVSRIVVGQLDRPQLISRIHAARAAVALLVDEGLLVRERELTFESVDQFDSLEDWLRYRELKDSLCEVAESLVNRARTMLSAAGGKLQLRERAYACRLRQTAKR